MKQHVSTKKDRGIEVRGRNFRESWLSIRYDSLIPPRFGGSIHADHLTGGDSGSLDADRGATLATPWQWVGDGQ